MPNDEIIVTNPKPPGQQSVVQTPYSREETIDALRKAADDLEDGAPLDSEAEDDRS